MRIIGADTCNCQVILKIYFLKFILLLESIKALGYNIKEGVKGREGKQR